MTVFLSILLGVFFGAMFLFFMREKRANDKLYEIAVTQFYDAADGIMKTSDEVPDGILRLLADMSNTLQHDGAAMAYYAAVKEPKRNRSGKSVYGDASKKLRPELEMLLSSAALGWLSALRYKSTFVGLAISRHVRDEQIRSRTLAPDPKFYLPERVQSLVSRAA